MDLRLIGKPDVDKAKNLVCALVHFEGGRFEGKTRLNKAFWRAHVYHYRHHAGLLSKYPIARLPEGPAIDDLDDLLVILEREGRIEIQEQPKHGHIETVVVLRSAPPVLEADEETAVREAIEWIKGKTAVQVRDESHELSAAWQRGKNGEIIDLAFDALDREEINALANEEKKIAENLEWAKKLIGASLGE